MDITKAEPEPPTYRKPVVVGLYGIPASGKSHMLQELRDILKLNEFQFYEGSEVIDEVCPGGLSAFCQMDHGDQAHWRSVAINTIERSASTHEKTAVVAGHFMFWPEGEIEGHAVYTQADMDIYTHILYLDTPSETIANYRAADNRRKRSSTSISHLDRWKAAEKEKLRSICRLHAILFVNLTSHLRSAQRVANLLRDFRRHTRQHNESTVESKLYEILQKRRLSRAGVSLLFDSDKTLTSQDSGNMFWKLVSDQSQSPSGPGTLQHLFGSPLRYSYTAFRQATLLYEEALNDEDFEAGCRRVASAIVIYPELANLLRLAAKQSHVRVIIITCGLRQVWEEVLKREELFDSVDVIGGGRLQDGYVVTPEIKGLVAHRLRRSRCPHVCAFGDSPLDIAMLQNASEAIVVTGDMETRSKSMEEELFRCIGKNGFWPRQVVFPPSSPPRLDTKRLPLVSLADEQVIASLLGRRDKLLKHVVHMTGKSAAKLLMTSTRDQSGPRLREAHWQVGRYLAIEILGRVVGLETFSIPHPQGHPTDGYRLLNEKQTLIVALMRSGEPMAFGISEIFTLASFIHANSPTDILDEHLKGRSAIILVDSVINSGKTMLDFIRHLTKRSPVCQIVVVVGVIYGPTLASSQFIEVMLRYPSLRFVALRLSMNQFTGTRTTDTGNLLFNTTYLP